MDGPPAIGQSVTVSNAATDLPLRQITRLRTEMAIASGQANARLFSGRQMLAIDFGIVARTCLPDWTVGPALIRPAVPKHAISIRRLALSLGAARETVRRRVGLLLEAGALTMTDDGVSLAATAANEALVHDYYTVIHDLTVRLIEDVAATTDLRLDVAPKAAFGIADVIARGIDTLLLPIDTYRPTTPDPVAVFLWSGLTAFAVRRITYDPALSRRYANAMPPDELRAGLSLKRLATALSIPYATAWRHMRTLDRLGMVTRLGEDSWTVQARNLERVGDVGAKPSALTVRKLRELAQLGFSPNGAESRYLAERPPLASFDALPAS